MITVYAYVCGDIIHKGHLYALNAAAAMGDFLIVGVLTDEAIQEKKPPPILPFDDRLALVQALRMVDIAVPQATYAPRNNVLCIKPDILMECISHSEALIANSRTTMQQVGGRVVILGDLIPNISSTVIKGKVNADTKKL